MICVYLIQFWIVSTIYRFSAWRIFVLQTTNIIVWMSDSLALSLIFSITFYHFFKCADKSAHIVYILPYASIALLHQCWIINLNVSLVSDNLSHSKAHVIPSVVWGWEPGEWEITACGVLFSLDLTLSITSKERAGMWMLDDFLIFLDPFGFVQSTRNGFYGWFDCEAAIMAFP